MATRSLTRFLSKPKLATSLISRRLSISTATTSTATRSRLFLFAPLPSFELRSLSFRGFSTDADEQPQESEKKENIVLEGCDFKHWMVIMERPEGDPSRDQIIDTYVKTLAMAVGSEEEAIEKIYSVSTRCYYAFSFVGDKELSEKVNDLPNVRLAVPDSYLDAKNKDYGGEPFINGKAVPYDPKYHKEWLRNNNQSNGQPNSRGPRRSFEQPRNNFQNNQRGAWRGGNQNVQSSPRDTGRGQEFQNNPTGTNSPRDMGRGQEFQNNPTGTNNPGN